jgi:ABC-2 type transport system permease protein
MFPLTIGLLIIALTLLISSLMASAGVLVSLRASTVKQAQQTLSIGIMAVALIPVLIFFVLPDSIKKPAVEALMGLNVTGIAIGALLLLAVANAIILYAAMLRFKRSRLILD